jgi:hypothetical protein
MLAVAFLTLFYTRGLGKVFFTYDAYDGYLIPNHTGFLCFLTKVWQFSNWLKVMLPYRGWGEGCLQDGGGDSLMAHSAGSVTTQSIAFKYVMASEPYRYTRYLKQVMAGFPFVKVLFLNYL